MPKPSEIFDTAEAISRVGGNEEIIKTLDIVHTEWGDTVHIADVIELLTTKDQEKEEAIRAERKHIAVALLKYQSESGNSHIDIEWFTKVLLALPTEDNK